MLFDTDVIIWVFRGNGNAARLVEETDERRVSVVTYMELLQGARDRRELRQVKSFLSDFAFRTLPLTENIGHRACIYMEEYALKTAMCVADALIAATAAENDLTLCTGNRKDYEPVGEIELNVFRP